MGDKADMKERCYLVLGATGLVGSAAIGELSRAGETVIAATRRPIDAMPGVENLIVDLRDDNACRSAFSALGRVTHIVYAALYEQASLVSGWADDEQIRINTQMFRNVLDPLIDASGALEHVTLLQGTKAYGSHVRAIPIPAREDRDEWRSQPNFYWEQEHHLRERNKGTDWTWTVLRPTLIVGGGVGGAMNVMPAIGVFGALLADVDEPFAFPGGAIRIGNACDVDLLARAIAWSGTTPAAHNQVFSVHNGDVYTWEGVWSAVANALGMETGGGTARSLEEFCRPRAADWDRIRRRHNLISPDLETFVGASLQYCDFQFRYGQEESGPASIVSNVKIQLAGFTEVMHSEDMFAKWLRDLQRRRLLPSPR